jgi:hypothetical protein
LGPEVGAVATLAGFPPDPEQQMLLDAAFALDEHGKSVAFKVVVIAPRQNLKTGFFKQVALGQLFVRDERLVVWSAHEFDTAQEALTDVEALIDGSDLLRRRVKLTERGNVASRGAVPEIQLTSGARLKFKTRTSGGGRGLSGRKVFLDEGYALQEGQIGALMPIMLAQPDPQVYVGSSACRPESSVLWGYVQDGRAGNDPRMVYAEWCAPDPAEICERGAGCDHARTTPGCACDKPELLRPVHSAITRGRILVQTIVDLRGSMPPEEYGREVMGWHDRPAIEVWPIPKDIWVSLADPGSAAGDRLAFGISATPRGTHAAIGVAGVRPDGLRHVELIDHRQGTGWVVDRVAGAADETGRRAGGLVGKWKPAAVVIDPGGPAGYLIPALEEALTDPETGELRATLLQTKARDVAQATDGFIAACGVAEGDEATLRYRPHPALDSGVKEATTKPLGDGRKFDERTESADISPLRAVSLGLWGLVTAEDESEAVEPWVMYG